MGRLFVRVMLSQRGCVTVSVLALSGAPRQLSQRESLGRRGEASRNIQSLSLWEQQRRPPPVAETGSRCWGRGQQDVSDSEADAGSRNPGSVTEGDGEGKPFTIKPLHSDKQTFCQSDTIVALPILCQHPCPLRRSAPALPKGEPLQRVSFTFCYHLLLYQSNKSKL